MNLSTKTEPIIQQLSVFVTGIEVPGKVTFRGGKPPTRTQGDIAGWSLSSRRRLRQFLMRHQAPAGYTTFGADLTIPAYPVGHPQPCATKEECQSIFGNFRKRMDRIGVCSVWRMEVQPRLETKRQDIRGVEQAHWHIVGGAPENLDLSEISRHWLESLGERAKVLGAAQHACNVSDCGDWTQNRLRYLFDHASKAKVAQIAKGWGKHWGVTRRAVWQPERAEIFDMTQTEQVHFLRYIRRLTARRVPDRRAIGGIPWGVLSIQPSPSGTRLLFMGGVIWCPSWDGKSKPSRDTLRHIVKCLGAAKLNVWALKTSKCQRSAGQFFGVTRRVIECAKETAKSYLTTRTPF